MASLARICTRTLSPLFPSPRVRACTSSPSTHLSESLTPSSFEPFNGMAEHRHSRGRLNPSPGPKEGMTKRDAVDNYSWLDRCPARIRKWINAVWPAARFVCWCWPKFTQSVVQPADRFQLQLGSVGLPILTSAARQEKTAGVVMSFDKPSLILMIRPIYRIDDIWHLCHMRWRSRTSSRTSTSLSRRLNRTASSGWCSC